MKMDRWYRLFFDSCNTKTVATQKDLLSLVCSGAPARIQTVNLQTLALARSSPALRHALLSATHITADGWPVAVALRSHSRPVGRVTGSDFVRDLATTPDTHLRIALVGGTELTGNDFERILSAVGIDVNYRWHGLKAGADISSIAKGIASCPADLVLVSLTLPDGDIWAAELFCRGAGRVVMNVGAAVDMVTGRQPRAPTWVQRLGMEWLYRLVRQPRRLARRYLVECPPALLMAVIPQVVRRFRNGHAVRS